MSALDGETIYTHDLPFFLHEHQKDSHLDDHYSLKKLQAKAEIDSIRYALTQTNNNKSKAAKMLGIHRTHLYKKKHDLSLS